MKKYLILLKISLLALTVSAQTQDDLYIEHLKSEFKNFEKKIKKNDGVFIDGKIVTLIIDANGEVLEGTGLPTILKEVDQFRYRIILMTTEDDDKEYTFKIDGKEYNPTNEFTIFNTKKDDNKGIAGLIADSNKVKMHVSDTSDVFSEKVYFKVKKKLDEKDTTIFDWEIKLTSSTNYHVAIMGGYFHSALNNPSNIVKAPLFDSTDSTLIGDFTNHQRKLSVMAVFYPWERYSGYQWKDLKFYERFSLGFGIGLDEEIFDDLFAGLNFEFAKGGYLSGGIHCGKHNVLATNPDFDFGSELWDQSFDNSLIKEEWNWSYYLGVVIDFRVITSMIGTRDKLNKSNSKD